MNSTHQGTRLQMQKCGIINPRTKTLQKTLNWMLIKTSTVDLQYVPTFKQSAKYLDQLRKETDKVQKTSNYPRTITAKNPQYVPIC